MSDQDFFFDEDEAPKKKPVPKPASKPASGKSTASGAKRASAPAVGGLELTWTVTALIGVVALLLGVIVGYVIPKGADIATPTTAGVQMAAPQLTPEQMSTGELPAGHPSIGDAAGATTGTAAPSDAATGN